MHDASEILLIHRFFEHNYGPSYEDETRLGEDQSKELNHSLF